MGPVAVVGILQEESSSVTVTTTKAKKVPQLQLQVFISNLLLLQQKGNVITFPLLNKGIGNSPQVTNNIIYLQNLL